MKINPFLLDSICSRSLVKILSINVECPVILVGLEIRGKKDDVKSCSLNLFEKSQISVSYVILNLSILVSILLTLVLNKSSCPFWWSIYRANNNIFTDCCYDFNKERLRYPLFIYIKIRTKFEV